MFIGVGVDGTLCSSPLPLQIAFGEAGAEIIGKNLVCALGGREANVATFKMHAAVTPDRRRKRCNMRQGRWVGRYVGRQRGR